jgi:hypothetical protein
VGPVHPVRVPERQRTLVTVHPRRHPVDELLDDRDVHRGRGAGVPAAHDAELLVSG